MSELRPYPDRVICPTCGNPTGWLYVGGKKTAIQCGKCVRNGDREDREMENRS